MSQAATWARAPLPSVSWSAAFATFAAAQRGRLAPWLAVAMGVGIGVYFAWPSEPDARLRWVAPTLVLAAFALGRRAPFAGWLLGLVAAAALGAALASWHAGTRSPALELPRGAVVVVGTVRQVDLLPEGRRITLDAPRLDSGETLSRHLRVRLKRDDLAPIRPGDTLTVRALLRPPAAPAYPGAWDFQRAAFFSGLGGSGFAIGRATVAAGEAAAPPLAGLRTILEARIAAALPGAEGAIAAALLTGSQSAIPQEAMAAMRDSGLAHLLSVSGLHIAIVMGLSFALIRGGIALVPPLALRIPGKATAALGALAVGGLYMLLTGAQVPMQRSFAMAAFATLALLTGRRAITLRAWALAAAIVLVLAPDALLGPSFQMSFAAVLALIAGWDALRPHLPRAGEGDPWARRLLIAGFGVIATSLLAGAATAPFALHHFGRVQLFGVFANAIAVPLTSVLVMPAGMAAAALMPFGLEDLALRPMGWGIEAMLVVARTVAAWPGASLAVPPIPPWGAAICGLGLAWLGLWRGGLRLLGLPLLALGLGSGAMAPAPDLLVAADARLIAWRHADGAVFAQTQSGASPLTRDAWARRWGQPEGAKLPEAATDPTCRPGACLVQPVTDGPIAVVLRGAQAEQAARRAGAARDPAASLDQARWCSEAAVVVSAEPVRGRCAAAVVDRFTVWRDGAHAVWLRPEGALIVSDRARRGARPWVPPPPRPRASEDPAATWE